jgi:4a-hydroxytetrahydrobiopterin dehydratase
VSNMSLTEKKCVPCEGGILPFTREKAEEYLKMVEGWNLIDGSIEREFQLKNFKEALAFINKVGNLAESEGHHPDVLLHSYRKVKLTLSTHVIRGLSLNDFILAAKIDMLER